MIIQGRLYDKDGNEYFPTLVRASDPTVADGSGANIDVGFVWLNTVSNKAYICFDNTPGAAVWIDLTAAGGGGGGVTDHGLLTGLGDDDHSQYHNDTRGDTRYYTKSQVDSLIAGVSSVYDLVKCKGDLSSASFQNVESTLIWASPVIGSGSSNISISGSEITLDVAGTYKFTVTLRTDNGNRTELFIRTYIDTGGGKVQDTDEIVSDYVSRDTDQDTGAVTLITALEASAGDVVEFRGFGDTDGTCVGLDAGTILLVERVA